MHKGAVAGLASTGAVGGFLLWFVLIYAGFGRQRDQLVVSASIRRDNTVALTAIVILLASAVAAVAGTAIAREHRPFAWVVFADGAVLVTWAALEFLGEAGWDWSHQSLIGLGGPPIFRDQIDHALPWAFLIGLALAVGAVRVLRRRPPALSAAESLPRSRA